MCMIWLVHDFCLLSFEPCVFCVNFFYSREMGCLVYKHDCTTRNFIRSSFSVYLQECQRKSFVIRKQNLLQLNNYVPYPFLGHYNVYGYNHVLFTLLFFCCITVRTMQHLPFLQRVNRQECVVPCTRVHVQHCCVKRTEQNPGCTAKDEKSSSRRTISMQETY